MPSPTPASLAFPRSCALRTSRFPMSSARPHQLLRRRSRLAQPANAEGTSAGHWEGGWSGSQRSGRPLLLAPHVVGKDDSYGEEDDKAHGRRGVGQEGRKCVHGGVKDRDGEEVAAGAIVHPSQNEADGDEKDDANQDVLHQGKAKGAVKIERGVPERPRQPNQKGREKREKRYWSSGRR